MSQLWQQFLIDYQVALKIPDDQDTRSETELSEFEKNVGFNLPTDYKEICHFLGTGIFREVNEDRFNVRIWCPDIEYSNEVLRGLQNDVLFSMQQGREYGTKIEDLHHLEQVEELLRDSFMFADNDKQRLFFWDLRTYSELDDSYDIYLLPYRDSPLTPYKTYEKIHRFCSRLWSS
ncbi:SMI1/KNR4 family protein [Oculatella sp. LEGE 06141]|uniref:SMI1/KNR4 family protein n=1 Tax=Oculatella sp. LEGE 06141 TaxID=1828648 RepID=UPI001881C02B|nr:SMI1/KNR4 family protein [Oculatella sp. LEGE 06141]MBE9179407.1 SMI1/KNR4 family protein [Oculatella sp. LEGE 06141]